MCDIPHPPGLEEKLCPVGSLQPEDVLLLLVVGGLGGEGVVHADGVAHVVTEGAALEAVLVLVQVEHCVPQRGVEHLPPTLAHRCCRHNVSLFNLYFNVLSIYYILLDVLH